MSKQIMDYYKQHLDVTDAVLEVGDTVLVYTEEDNKWTTEIVDTFQGELCCIWENTYKRVATPLKAVPSNFIIILIKCNGVKLTDLAINPKTRLDWGQDD